MYGSKAQYSRKCYTPKWWCVRLSKNALYEKPYIVKGNNKHTGSKDTPKDICKDKELWNKGKLEHY